MADQERKFFDSVVSPAVQAGPDQQQIETALQSLVTDLLRVGAEERLWQLAEIQHCLKLWHGEPSLYWNEEARAWQSVWDAYRDGLIEEEDLEAFDRDINFYRPLLESVIAASTIEVPRIYFVPKRASDPTDIITSREATKVSSYLDQINDAGRLLQNAQFVLANQHFVAGYAYYETDAQKYGSDIEPQMGMVDKTRQIDMCPNCANDLTNTPPDDTMAPYKYCEGCDQLTEPQPDEETYQEEGVVGFTSSPRSKVCIEVYGPQQVHLPYYIRELKASPYLMLEEEVNVGLLADMYQDHAEAIMSSSSAQGDKYGRWAREPVNTTIPAVSDRATHRRMWVRPWAFNFIKDVGLRKTLREQNPEGALICFVNELLVQVKPSDLDQHWAITETPFSETVHDDPAGKIVIASCEMQNDLLQLLMENLKHNVPETYIDSQLLDLDKYKKLMARPGQRVPVKRQPGTTISNSIHETRSVSLPQESLSLYSIAEQVSQFVSKAMPSIFGGYLQRGSKTAFEYDASQKAALQRVALTLSLLNSWWSNLKFKAVQLYVANAQKMEEYAVRSGGSFKPVTIDPANLQGNLDRAVPETSANFPVTWSQKRDFFIQTLQSRNMQLIQILFRPENTTLLKELIGIPELFIPGEQDRMKQLLEISELLKSPPDQSQSIDPMSGMPTSQEHSTIPPDERTDNGPAHILTLQDWLNSDDCREAEKTNPDGVANVRAHLNEHIQLQLTQQQPPPPGPGQGDQVGPPPPDGGMPNGGGQPPVGMPSNMPPPSGGPHAY